MAQVVKNLPAMTETRVQSLGQEDPLEKKMATHSSIPWTEEPGRLQSMVSQRIRHNWATFTWWPSGKESSCSTGDAEDSGLIPGQDALLEEGKATFFSILAGKIPWTRSLPGYSPKGHKESDTTEWVHTHTNFEILKHQLPPGLTY